MTVFARGGNRVGFWRLGVGIFYTHSPKVSGFFTKVTKVTLNSTFMNGCSCWESGIGLILSGAESEIVVIIAPLSHSANAGLPFR
jgi:hypothetical protein